MAMRYAQRTRSVAVSGWIGPYSQNNLRDMMRDATLYYVLDPMCSWCWAFNPHWQQVRGRLPQDMEYRYVMGGLAPDSDEPMPMPMREHLQSIWRTIAERTGATFNYEFWSRCTPRRSTYPACRAVIAAGLQDESKTERMIAVIQQAYYMEARNPSDASVLSECAAAIGLDSERFAADIAGAAVNERLQQDFALRDRFGVQGFPSLVLHYRENYYPISSGYCDAQDVLDRVTTVTQ